MSPPLGCYALVGDQTQSKWLARSNYDGRRRTRKKNYPNWAVKRRGIWTIQADKVVMADIRLAFYIIAVGANDDGNCWRHIPNRAGPYLRRRRLLTKRHVEEAADDWHVYATSKHEKHQSFIYFFFYMHTYIIRRLRISPWTPSNYNFLKRKLFLRSKTWYGSSSSALLSSPLSDRMLSVWCLRLMGRSLLKYILFCMGPSFFLKYHAVSERRHTEANVTSRATERQ